MGLRWSYAIVIKRGKVKVCLTHISIIIILWITNLVPQPHLNDPLYDIPTQSSMVLKECAAYGVTNFDAS